MGRFKENPRFKCISTRLTDEEFEELLQVCDRSRRTVSDMLREAVSALLLQTCHEEERRASEL